LAPVCLEAAEDGAHELARVLSLIASLRGQPDAEGGGETLEIFDAGFVQAIGGKIHARAAT
jgi:hypothetical protein